MARLTTPEQRTRAQQLGRTLRAAREELGLSGAEVTRELGLDDSYLSQLERGLIFSPNPEIVAQIAVRYRLPLGGVLRTAGCSTLAAACETVDQRDVLVKLFGRKSLSPDHVLELRRYLHAINGELPFQQATRGRRSGRSK